MYGAVTHPLQRATNLNSSTSNDNEKIMDDIALQLAKIGDELENIYSVNYQPREIREVLFRQLQVATILDAIIWLGLALLTLQ